jgi:cephalosporin-C deacetylase
MPHFDLSLDELQTYRSSVERPSDLDTFWHDGLALARDQASDPVLRPYEPGVYGQLEVDDVTFSGADGHPVRAWFMRPRGVDEPVPCLVRFIGYGGGRSLPVDHALYPATGYAIFVMDSRAQGGAWSPGATGDPGAGVSGPEHPGVMTRGLGAPETYYYRRLYLDAARAVDTAAALPQVDAERLAVGGMSQGGGLALAAAALAPELVRLCLADMPFLCDIPRGVSLSPDLPYSELAVYLAQHSELAEAARRTLSYVDCANLAPSIRARCHVSVGLMDTICPPSTVFAAYNAIEAPKTITIYDYSGHEVPALHAERNLREFAAQMAP